MPQLGWARTDLNLSREAACRQILPSRILRHESKVGEKKTPPPTQRSTRRLLGDCVLFHLNQ